MNRTGTVAAAAVALAIAGCGSSHGSSPAASHRARPSTPAASSTSAPPGPQRFLAEVRAAGFGSKDMASAPDTLLLSIGKNVCKALSTSQGTDLAGYSTLIESLAKNHANPTIHQATVWVDSAIRNLCPENSNLMPSGAP